MRCFLASCGSEGDEEFEEEEDEEGGGEEDNWESGISPASSISIGKVDEEDEASEEEADDIEVEAPRSCSKCVMRTSNRCSNLALDCSPSLNFCFRLSSVAWSLRQCSRTVSFWLSVCGAPMALMAFTRPNTVAMELATIF